MPTILTNALLSIGFQLVSNFANVVPIPSDMVPSQVEDLQDYRIGGAWPTDLDFFTKRRSMFMIRHGAVWLFNRPDAYLGGGHPGRVAPFRGQPTLTSNQVVELATKTVQQLCKPGALIDWLRPVVRRYREPGDGPELPFYELAWFNVRQGVPTVSVEVDARDGHLGSVSLFDPAFYDLAFAWEMRRRVCVTNSDDAEAAQRLKSEQARRRAFPYPSTNQVLEGIRLWLRLCGALHIEATSATNLASVDWNLSCTYTNHWESGPAIESQVTFTNGTWFTIAGGVPCAYFAADACYVDNWAGRRPEDWFLLEGKIAWHWQELAARLERAMTDRLGIPPELIAVYPRKLKNYEPEFGGRSIRRVLVEWRNGEPEVEHRDGASFVKDPHLGFAAEFDLESGELKAFWLHDPKLIEALGRAQASTQVRSKFRALNAKEERRVAH